MFWHQALAFALTGVRLTELGRQDRPDVEQLLEALQEASMHRSNPGTPVSARDWVAMRRGTSQRWPCPVPADLMDGLGYAQFTALLRCLITRLDLAEPPAVVAAMTAERTLTADERRLLDDVPPHHGR